MKHYILKIKPISPFLTPIESDTLFGHICWAMKYLEGSKKVSTFLEEFDGQTPPLIMSGAFPKGCLSFPLLPPFSKEEMPNLEALFLDKGKGDKFDFIQWLKKLSRQYYINLDTFLKYRQAFSKYDIYTAILKGELSEFRFSKIKPSSQTEEESQTIEVHHNAINRITGTVEEGRLFSTSSTFYKKDTWLDVYIKTGYFTSEELAEIFGFIAANGFGADKSTGSGRFEFKLREETPFNDIDDFNAFLLLSNTHPSVLQKYKDYYYTTQTKFGKLGGAYSSNAKYSPFKNPVILLQPGSVIYSSESIEYCGENFKEIHPQLTAVQHYGIGFPIKMRLKNEA